MSSRPTKQDIMPGILAFDAYMRGPEEKRAIRGLNREVGEATVRAFRAL